jgi:predicted ABC-type ATPase
VARILVLAGVNGAGKSSLLGLMLQQDGATWFNPDAFTRQLVERGWPLQEANATAWQEGTRRLREAMENDRDFAFETTLGANTIPKLLREACQRHEVTIWFCGLDSIELHLQRVAERVIAGGHDIPEEKIRQRYDSSRINLIELLPHLTTLHVYDNSRPPDAEGQVEPLLVLEVHRGHILCPTGQEEFAQVPEWAKPVVWAALKAFPAAD